METYLYFRKFRPATFTHTATAGTQNFTITGLGGDDIDSATEIASITVTAADAANTAIGNAYAAISAIGDVTTLTNDGGFDATAVSNSVVTIDLTTGGSADAANGYNLETGDIVTVTLQQGLETSFVYPASSLMGIEGSTATTTTLRFRALKSNNQDDEVVITHDSGKFQQIVDGLNAAIHSSKGGVVTVIDGSDGKTVLSPDLKGLGISGITYTPEAS